MNPHGKNRSAAPWPAYTPCPLCGAFPELNTHGEVSAAWRESFGHRSPKGDPCKGVAGARPAKRGGRRRS